MTPADLAQRIAGLTVLPLAERVRAARDLARTAPGVLSAAADGWVVEMTATMTYPQVADALDTSAAAVNKAVTRAGARGTRVPRRIGPVEPW